MVRSCWFFWKILYNAMSAGVDGYLLKDDSDEQLLIAIDHHRSKLLKKLNKRNEITNRMIPDMMRIVRRASC